MYNVELEEASAYNSATTHVGSVFISLDKTPRTEKPAVGNSIGRGENSA